MKEASHIQVEQVASIFSSTHVLMNDGNVSGVGGDKQPNLMSFEDPVAVATAVIREVCGVGREELWAKKQIVADAIEAESAPAAEVAKENAMIQTEEERILDLTSFQLNDSTDLDLPLYIKELDLTTNLLTSIDPRIANLPHLQRLSFEQNLLADNVVSMLGYCTALNDLKALVLRDNKLLKLPEMSNLVNFTLLDVSYNKVLSMNGLSAISPSLTELHLSKNEIGNIEEIEHLTRLRFLSLAPTRSGLWRASIS